MHKLFSHFYEPTKSEFAAMWEECTFSFDANVLLHVYRYTPQTRDRLIAILEGLQDRIWLPHQSAYEYHSNRLEVISSQRNAYSNLKKQVSATLSSLAMEIERDYKRHSFIDTGTIIAQLLEVSSQISSQVDVAEAKHPDFLGNDLLREKLTLLFNNKVGKGFSDAQLAEKIKQAEERFSKSVPPGYKDATRKKGDEKYGDAILWFQLLEKAETDKKPVIFVTDDTKEDWYFRHEGRTVSPRPELIKEMLEKAGVSFYAYQTDQFIQYAQGYLKLGEQQTAIEEVRRLRKEDEEERQFWLQVEDAAVEYTSLFPDDEIPSYMDKNTEDTNYQPYLLDFQIGQKVKHKVFGVGTVIKVIGKHEQTQVTVAFPNVGIKRLVAVFAKLEKA